MNCRRRYGTTDEVRYCAKASTLFSRHAGVERTLVIYVKYHLVVVKGRSLNSELTLCFSGSTPVQCCLAAAVCLSSVLPIRGTRHAVPTVSRGPTMHPLKKQGILLHLLLERRRWEIVTRDVSSRRRCFHGREAGDIGEN